MKIWLRPLPFALLAAYGVARADRAPVDDAAPSRSAALCGSLAKSQHVECEPGDVVWINGPSGISGAMRGRARALVRGKDKNPPTSTANDPSAPPDAETFDLFHVDARLSPEGQLLDVGAVHNLTKTTNADEGLPVLRGSLAAYVVEIDGHPEAVQVLDLAGHEPHAYDELTRTERWQVKIADLQGTGNPLGVKKSVFALVPPPKAASLVFREDGPLEIKTDPPSDPPLLVDPVRGTAPENAHVRASTEGMIAKPPTFGPWMSDRLRAASWFGDEKNQILKAIVFTSLEWIKGKKASLTGDTGADQAQEDLGSINTTHVGPSNFSDVETGWPPKPLEPMLKPPLAGEGQWIRLDDDPFITPVPGNGTPFVTTFVRTDPGAQQTRVYVTLWDPRLVALHMEAGSVEPVSATGEAGTGQIPREPQVMRKVVAGFNGGFQATHGEFGMQADGVLYLPPKPYAATVIEMRDGTTAFTAWPPDQPSVPDDIYSFRQNMTPMVQNDKYNPWGRAWWGGVPPGWKDAVHTTRSGLCLTKEGFVAYLFGHDIGPEPLGRAMLAARCQLGIHLDMNPGLAGFEFYNMQSASNFKPLGRPLQPDWEYEGTVKDLPELKFRSRRMTKTMGHIQFPRYIQRDGRDFFYLTTRAVIPGAPLEPGTEWRTKGLPQHGYPLASALTTAKLFPNGNADRKARVLRIDPRAVASEKPEGDNPPTTVLVLGRPPKTKPSADPGDRKLWIGQHVFTIDKSAPPNGVSLANVLPPGSVTARGAVGISDEDGFLNWVELPPDDAPSSEASAAMLDLLQRAGCTTRGLLAGDLRAFLGGTLDTAGEPAAPAVATARLTRTATPAAKQIYESVAIVQQPVWQPLQSQRVKWRPTLAPPEPKPSASASSSAPPPAPPKPPH
ncbi:MAG: hypothetical protein U0270_07805 [Labilithrix sp.]